MYSGDSLVQQMISRADDWERAGDHRFVFLRCYSMMTKNMKTAISQNRFHDPAWVEELLEYFASYYFNALNSYEKGDAQTPMVWKQVHDASRSEKLHVVQHLLLGINAHINYDLVLTIYNKITPCWCNMSDTEKNLRHDDHSKVNQIIAETIDMVQDQVIEKESGFMELIDVLFGRVDEWLLSNVITGWRAKVWSEACAMLDTKTDMEREDLRKKIEIHVMKTAAHLLAF